MMYFRLITIVFLVAFLQIGINAQTIVWKKLISLPESYYGGEAVSLNNVLYLVSGQNGVSTTSSFYKFNPAEQCLSKLADIPNPTTNMALAVVNNKIYAIGGDLFQDSNREYNPKTNTWKLLEPMPTARQHIDCGVFGNKIFIMGGITSWELISKKNEVYDITTNSWSEKAAVPSLRNCPAIVTLDSLIYVIGGGGSKTSIWEKTASVECYNIHTDKWEDKTALPYVLYKPAAVVANNKLIVLGGSTTINGKTVTLSKTLIYDLESDEWIETTPLPSKNIFFGCTSIGNKIYVLGGTAGVDSDWSTYSNIYEGTVID